MAEEDIPKTAIITPFGLYEFVQMPFDLRNSAQSFQRFMDNILRGLDFCYGYIDDLLIASRNRAEHLQHLRLVFERLSQHGIVVNIQKCEFGVSSLNYLGHRVSKDGILPLPEKVEAISSFPTPTTQRKLKEYLGLTDGSFPIAPRCSCLSQPFSRGKPNQTSHSPGHQTQKAPSNRAKTLWLRHPFFNTHTRRQPHALPPMLPTWQWELFFNSSLMANRFH